MPFSLVCHTLFSSHLNQSPPFTWTPQKWVEPGFNPLYTFHMRTSNRVQPAFYNRVQPTSEGGLNSYLSEFEVLEKMADHGRMRTDAEIPLVLNVWSEGSIQRQLQGSLHNVVPYKKISVELGNALHRKWILPHPIQLQCGQRMCDSCSLLILSLGAEHCRAEYAVLPSL